MKKLIALFVVAAVSFAAATTLDARRFGIKGGVNVANLETEAGFNTTLGYQAGLAYQLDLPLGFSIQPELMYHVKAAKFEDIESQLDFGFVEIPVNIQWGLRFSNRNIRVFAQASPFIGYAVYMPDDTNSELDKYKDLLGSVGVDTGALDAAGEVGKWTNVNRFSYGCGLGVGVQLWAFQLTAQYVWNFGSLEQKPSAELFNDNNFGGCVISLGILFGGSKSK